MIIDTEGIGLGKILRDYEQLALRYLWNNEDGNSRAVHSCVDKALESESKRISRASIINFLKRMVDDGILTYSERTGKGGYHRVYRSVMNESSFKSLIINRTVESFLRDFPEETREVIERCASHD